MRRMWGIVCASLAVFLLTVSAAALDDGDAGMSEAIEREFVSIAEEVAEENGSSLAEEIASVAFDRHDLAERLDGKAALSEVLGVTLNALPSAVSLMCRVLGLVILCAVTKRVTESASGRLAAGAELCSAAVFLAAFLSVGADSLYEVERFFDRICGLVRSMIPITGAVWAMGGNVSAATVGTASLYGILSAAGEFCSATVMPVCCVMAVTAVSSALSGGSLLSGFSGAVKKIYNFAVGILMTVLVFALGAQTSLASAADTAAARGAKLVSSTVIPVIGGAVGDTLRTVAGSAQYIKSVVGVGGIALILSLTLPTLVSLLLFRGALLLGGGAADMMGCVREARLLSELGNIYGLLVGAVSICSVSFAVAMGIFVKCTVAGA